MQDTGEARIPGRTPLRHRADGPAPASRRRPRRPLRSYDLALLERAYGIGTGGAPVTVVPHGPYDHVRSIEARDRPRTVTTGRSTPSATRRRFNLLFFGVIRPYKGLEDLVEAFGSLPEHVRERTAADDRRRDLGGLGRPARGRRLEPGTRPDHGRQPLRHRRRGARALRRRRRRGPALPPLVVLGPAADGDERRPPRRRHRGRRSRRGRLATTRASRFVPAARRPRAGGGPRRAADQARPAVRRHPQLGPHGRRLLRRSSPTSASTSPAADGARPRPAPSPPSPDPAEEPP